MCTSVSFSASLRHPFSCVRALLPCVKHVEGEKLKIGNKCLCCDCYFWQYGGLGGRAGRCQLSDGHGEEQVHASCEGEQENRPARPQVSVYGSLACSDCAPTRIPLGRGRSAQEGNKKSRRPPPRFRLFTRTTAMFSVHQTRPSSSILHTYHILSHMSFK